MRSATFATILAGIGVTFSLFVPRAAEACWACTTDGECPTGFSCEQNVGCMPTVDCKTDGDCGSGMRCVTETATQCTGSDSQSCHEINSCAPIWQAGCGSDADCGDGFTCVENGSLCNSSGCSTLAQCQAKQPAPASCNADSDCPSCWSCLDASDSGESCVNPGGPSSQSNGTVTSNGTATPPSSDKVCRPPYWGLSVNYSGPAPQTDTASGASPSANACSNIEATRAGYSGLDPKSSGSGSSGCSVGPTQGSNDGAPLWTLGAALAGLAVISRRKRANAKS
ncbi:MAG: MYXO-CTERM sorting domain-containing protein [Polyangiaceae bacterium]